MPPRLSIDRPCRPLHRHRRSITNTSPSSTNAIELKSLFYLNSEFHKQKKTRQAILKAFAIRQISIQLCKQTRKMCIFSFVFCKGRGYPSNFRTVKLIRLWSVTFARLPCILMLRAEYEIDMKNKASLDKRQHVQIGVLLF